MRLKSEIAVEIICITYINSNKILKLITQRKKREYRRYYKGCLWLDDPGFVLLHGQEICVLYKI